MIAYFCLECFAEVAPLDRSCPVCGETIAGTASDYEGGLIRALHHPKLPDRQVLAASILGRRRSVRAVPHLIEVARKGSNPYLAAQAIVALDMIGGEEAEVVLGEFADSPSFMVRRVARESLMRRDEMRAAQPPTGR